MENQLPKVAFYTLGGTIASVPDVNGRDAIPKLSGADLLAGLPQIETLAELHPRAFRQYPSGDLMLVDVLELADLIEMDVAHGFQGVVITQGTDTLEETSFLLDRVCRLDIPIVFTGAMRNAGLPGADGPANVLAAVRVATSPLARGLGPLVVFNDEIHLGRFVKKMHTVSMAAFHSPNTGPLGWITEDRVSIPLIPRERPQPLARPVLLDDLPRVALIKFGLDSDADLVESALHIGYSGVVIEAFGGGHVPSRSVSILERVAKHIPVVFVSRTGAGELYRGTYAFAGSERDMLARGIISAGTLDGAKARLLLMLLVASGADQAEIQRCYYHG